MVYLYQGQLNQAAVVASRNKSLSNPTYLWSMQHKLSGKQWRFIPYRIIPMTDYTPGYDLFCMTVSATTTEHLTGNTSCGLCVVNLYPGEYYLKIYEQVSPSNLNPALSHDVVNETIVNVVGTNQNEPVTYESGDDIFIIYNVDNTP